MKIESKLIFSKMNEITLNDIKLILRNYSFIYTIPVYWIVYLSIAYHNRDHITYLPAIIILNMVFIFESTINNMFMRFRNEIFCYYLFPINRDLLVLSKNISNIVNLLISVTSSLLIVFTFYHLNTGLLIDTLLYFLPALLTVQATGNIISVKSQCGEKKRTKPVSLRYILLNGIELIISYQISSFVKESKLKYLLYLLIVMLLYITTIKITSKLLINNKYKMLEEQ